MGKIEKDENENVEESQMDESQSLSYEEQLQHVSVIAKPIATKKVAKKIYKLIKKAAEHKDQKTLMRQGLKNVQSSIRKGEKGLLFIAGNVTPIDVICHIPGVCEEKNIDYIYTPSRDDLGLAMGAKRSCLMILIKENPDYKELYDDVRARMKAITTSTFLN
ncbi:hypothetical protein TNIN_320551 [Trichonephila inaurata madagascariensis]|uniref:Ribosomal protein eL8/eL30/eS12/Gadd45 domain-containing protein n=1 Tax=Trichonephila inaurata madagascariensis TaxID=2747483 RepID=A0A8X6I302_9ARAC|nr:hypothetical protein TNIN_320551 [Trichonephila inaurata madagascariensis]